MGNEVVIDIMCNDFNTRTCGGCSFNDGQCYTSLPPKYKCLFDNNFYDGTHMCHHELKPVIHAEWLEGSGIPEFVGDDWFLRPTYICSNCFDEEARASDYCPKCGAKMAACV